MAASENSSSFPLGGLILGLLGVLFVTLKLTNVIDWSWFLVLLPFIIPVVTWASIMCLAILAGILS